MKPALRHATLRLAALVLGAVGATAATPAGAQAGNITPFSQGAPGAALPAPWKLVTLPKIPRHTVYRIELDEGRPVLRARAEGSYGTLVHPLRADPAVTPVLAWRWRADETPARADLRTKAGDDLAAKVCVFFDVPLERLGAADRVKIRLGRSLFDPELPAATLCYVWDRTLAPGTVLANAYTDRVRYIVLRSEAAGELGRWTTERRRLDRDFVLAFGAEAEGGVPPITGVALATDGDNTGSTARASYGDLRLERE
jgi:hypothetical protein